MKLIKTNWDDKKIHNEVDKLISIHDDGELFIEEVYSENVLLDDNKIKSASYDNDKGFGLRAVHEDKIKFFHSSELDEESFKKALKSITYSGRNSETKNRYVKTNKRLYENLNPLSLVTLKSKIDFLRKVNDYARKLDNNVKQVSVSLNGNFQNIEIIKEGGNAFYDSRPLVRMNVTVSVEKKGKIETGSFGFGGRHIYEKLFQTNNWKNAVNSAFIQANVKLQAKEIPAGEQTVVLGPGWPGILLHEAIGHGLEGDFNRKNLSIF